MSEKERQMTPHAVMTLLPTCPACGHANYRFVTANVGSKMQMTAAACSRCNANILTAARERLGR